MPNKKYVFVSGCPRSGTTVLGHIFNWADDCFIGLERYGMLFERDRSAFLPDLFEYLRFVDYVKGDCPFNSMEANAEYKLWYANTEGMEMAGATGNIGDKIVTLWKDFKVFEGVEWSGKTVNIFHILRNVVDVAASFQKRQDDPEDGWQEGLEEGVKIWVRSVEETYRFVNAGGFSSRCRQLHLVNYDSLASEDYGGLFASVKIIYDLAGLSFADNTEAGLKKVLLNGSHRKKLRYDVNRLQSQIMALVPEAALVQYNELTKLSVC